MSSKKTAKEAQEYFRRVQEGSQEFASIPDAGLQQKIRKVGESAEQVIKHIQERTNPQNG